MARAEDIRSAVGNTPVVTSQGPLSVTLSLGVMATSGCDSETAEQVLRQADRALYSAKAAGRNCSQMACE